MNLNWSGVVVPSCSRMPRGSRFHCFRGRVGSWCLERDQYFFLQDFPWPRPRCSKRPLFFSSTSTWQIMP